MGDRRRIVAVSWLGMDMDAPTVAAHIVRFSDGSDEIHAGALGESGDGCWIARTCDPVTRNAGVPDGT